jgi:hypothetical protein
MRRWWKPWDMISFGHPRVRGGRDRLNAMYMVDGYGGTTRLS